MEEQFNRLHLDTPNDYDGHCDGKSTLYPLKIVPGSKAYRYDVTIIRDPENRRKELTNQSDQALRSSLKTCCSEIVEALFTKTNGFGVECKYIYDGKHTLFCNKEIKLERKSNLISAQDLPQSCSMFLRRQNVEITITANEAAPVLDYSNLVPALVSDVKEQPDRSVRMFLEILTSQFLVNTKRYQYVSAGTLFENDTRELVEGMQLRVGIKKGIRITGTPENAEAMMVLDMKRSAFISCKTLQEIYSEFLSRPNNRDNRRDFQNLMRGVYVVPTYDTSRTVKFGRLTQNPINSPEFVTNGKTIPEYFKANKGITLKYGSSPGMHPDQPNAQRVVYPLEVLRPLSGQVIPLEKLTTDVSKRLLVENSKPATERFTYVQQQSRMISTNGAAGFLAHWGVNISLENSVQIHTRNLPKIRTGGKVITQEKEAKWLEENNNAKFINPSTRLTKWIVAYDKSVQEIDVKEYIKKLAGVAANSGMKLVNPKAYRKTSPEGLIGLFKEYKEKQDEADKIQFIFYIDRKENSSHGRLKLLEAYYKTLTQHVIGNNIKAGSQVLKNVVMKLNTKTFGLCFLPVIENRNYSLDADDLLIIGLDISHPQKLSAMEKFKFKKNHPDLDNCHPSVVGICANKMTNRWGFAGDFFYQTGHKDEICPERLAKAVSQLVEVAKKANRTPQRVIVFRDGLSEGQQQSASKNEVPAIRDGIKKVYPSLDPKITFVVGTKDHNKRVFRLDGKNIVNTNPGDIIDSKIVREDVPEFYQQSHFPLKGCPKALQVATIQNDLQMTMGDIQKLILDLSCMHQIVATVTSLPLPIYLADECAKRGMEIYNELYSMRCSRNPRDRVEFAPELKVQDGIFDFDQLTEVLGYANSKLVATRFNA